MKLNIIMVIIKLINIFFNKIEIIYVLDSFTLFLYHLRREGSVNQG